MIDNVVEFMSKGLKSLHSCRVHVLKFFSICPDTHSGEWTAALFSLTSSWSTSVKVLLSSWTFPPIWSLPFLTSCHSSLAPKWLISDHSHLQIITANIINPVDPCCPSSSFFPTAEPVLLPFITPSWHDLQTPREGNSMSYWSPVNARNWLRGKWYNALSLVF